MLWEIVCRDTGSGYGFYFYQSLAILNTSNTFDMPCTNGKNIQCSVADAILYIAAQILHLFTNILHGFVICFNSVSCMFKYFYLFQILYILMCIRN